MPLVLSPRKLLSAGGYCDADFAGDACDRKSTSGFASLQGSATVAWI
mgnify:CR=1 FL=1